MNRQNPYREQIDACRPGSDDLSLPALAELASAIECDPEVAEELARSQRFDYAVVTAIHDVPLPTGLADRLLASLAAAEAEKSRLESAVATAVETPAPPHSASIPLGGEAVAPARRPARAPSRRWLLGSALAAAAALLLAMGVWQFSDSAPRQITEQELASAGMRWFSEAASETGWQAKAGDLAGFPRDRAVQVTPRQHKTFRTALGEQAVAYQLSPSTQKRAILFVVQTQHTYKVPTIPYQKLGTTGGMSLAAWQRGNLLYVLAVDGGPQRLDAYIRPAQITAVPRWPARDQS